MVESEKQLIKNYGPIYLLPIYGKILEKIIFNHPYGFLTTNNRITKNQSGFHPGDSATNQLLHFKDTIHQSFDWIWFFLEFCRRWAVKI